MQQDERESTTVPGLKNLGNTCFFASALQALASSLQVVLYIRTLTELAKPLQLPLTEAFLGLLCTLQPQQGSPAPASPALLLAELRKNIPEQLLESGEENDAVEALELLLDAVRTEMQHLGVADEPKSPFSELFSQSSISADVSSAMDSSLGSRLLAWRRRAVSPLQGHVAQEMVCTYCGNGFTTHASVFQTLALPVTKKTSSLAISPGTSIQSCLAKACVGIELIEGVACGRCSLKASLAASNAKALSSRHACITAHPISRQSSTESSPAYSRMDSPPKAAHTLEDAVNAATLPSALAAEASAAGDCCSSISSCSNQGQHETGCVADQQLHRDLPNDGEGSPKPNQQQQQAEDGGADLRNEPGLSPDSGQNAELSYSVALEMLRTLANTCSPLPDAIELERLAIEAGIEWVSKKTRVARSAPISRLPKVLALHLKRGVWTPNGRHLKLSGHVHFPERLDMLPYTTGRADAYSSQPSSFDLPLRSHPSAVDGWGNATNAAQSQAPDAGTAGNSSASCSGQALQSDDRGPQLAPLAALESRGDSNRCPESKPGAAELESEQINPPFQQRSDARGETGMPQACGMQYRLSAVVVHTGFSSSGHYHVYRRISSAAGQDRFSKVDSCTAMLSAAASPLQPKEDSGSNLAVPGEGKSPDAAHSAQIALPDEGNFGVAPLVEESALNDDPGKPKNLDAQAGVSQETWLSISDQSVQPASLKEVLACEATLLLYIRL